MRKNTTGQYVAFQAISKTDGSDVITGTPVVYYTIDGGTQAQTTATAVHEGNGQWSVALSQAETNGDHIVFSFVLTGAVTQTVNVYTIDADLTNLDVAVSTRSVFDPASDAVANVTLVGTVTTNTDMRGTDGANTVAPLDASATENAVWDAVVLSHTTNGTFGDSLLVAQGAEREVQVDSNHNVHAALHTCEPNVIDSSALAASAVTEIQTGLITTGTAFTHTNQAGDTMTVTIT